MTTMRNNCNRKIFRKKTKIILDPEPTQELFNDKILVALLGFDFEQRWSIPCQVVSISKLISLFH